MKDYLEMIFYCIAIVTALIAVYRWIDNKLQQVAQQEQNLSLEQNIYNDLDILYKQEYFSKARKDHLFRYIFFGIWIRHLYLISMRAIIRHYKKKADIK